MLKLCDRSCKSSILDYIGSDYSKCLYLYINLLKYEFTNPNFNIWASTNENGEIKALIAKYYTGIHVFCKGPDILIEDIIQVISENNPSIINGTGNIIKRLQENLPIYTPEFGSVGQIKNVTNVSSELVEVATIENMNEIARLLIEDQGLSGHYDVKLLEHQLKERFEEGFGRNYIIKKNNVIVSHCATYAQTKQIAVTSGVYTTPKERGNGYIYQLYCTLCSDLIKEGKEVFAFYYTPQAHKMHKKVGFDVISSWAKLVKNS